MFWSVPSFEGGLWHLYIFTLHSLHLGSNVSLFLKRKCFQKGLFSGLPNFDYVFYHMPSSEVKLWAYLGSFLPVSPPCLPPLQCLSHQISPFHSHHHPSGLDLHHFLDVLLFFPCFFPISLGRFFERFLELCFYLSIVLLIVPL